MSRRSRRGGRRPGKTIEWNWLSIAIVVVVFAFFLLMAMKGALPHSPLIPR